MFSSNKKKILVVEDETDIAESLSVRLELDHYQVIVAKNGQDGVTKARSEKPDLIILDVMMPKLNGFEVCKILKSESGTKAIPILMLTALQMVGDVDKAFECGANDYLSKPYTNERLLKKVHALLA
jgi:DNA-binding response OmpR family regulator